MKINSGPARPPRRRSLLRARKRLLLGILAGLVALGGAGLYGSYRSGHLRESVLTWVHDHGYFRAMNDVSPKRALALAPLRFLEMGAKDGSTPQLVIDLKFKHFQKIQAKREEALARELLVTEDGDMVPATIRHRDGTARVKLRLKGDWIDHLNHRNKWSFRIQTRGDDTIFGLRKFSIQHPKTRGFHGEPLYFATLEHLGVLAPRYSFVHAILNGTDLGIMALEEHFSKELLESNARREGVILKFDESMFWEGRLVDPLHNPFDSYRNASIDAFGTGRIEKSAKLSQDYRAGAGLLRAFVDGRIPASTVFDAEVLGRYLAVAEVWGSRHAMRWHNLRFYVNPVTMKLEPIGFDGNIHDRAHVRGPGLGRRIAVDEPIVMDMLADPAVRDAYERGIITLHEDLARGTFLAELKAKEQELLGDLGSEFFLLWEYPLDELVTRAELVRNAPLEPAPEPEPFEIPEAPAVSTILHAYEVAENDRGELQLGNRLPLPVRIEAIRWVDDRDRPVPGRETPGAGRLPLELPSTPEGARPVLETLAYTVPPDSLGLRLQVDARIESFPDSLYRTVARAYPPVRTEPPVPVATIAEALARHPFLTWDPDSLRFRARPGDWTVEGSLVTPAGATLALDPGTTLRFAAGEGLVIHGPVEFLGSESAPIHLGPIDPADGWQGLAVLDAGSPSWWRHVQVQHTTGVSRPGWGLTGGVNFYRSDIEMTGCVLDENRGEDALNIISSVFLLKDLEVSDTASDAFDSDFSQGRIEDGIFRNIGLAGGGDAIDVSGSTVSVIGTHFLEIRDKALSVGERSRMEARDLLIENVTAGAACKDGSELELTSSTIRGAALAGIMAYIKKPEFGPGTIRARDLRFEEVPRPTLVQDQSLVVLDGITLGTEPLDVDALYQTVMRPGLRR